MHELCYTLLTFSLKGYSQGLICMCYSLFQVIVSSVITHLSVAQMSSNKRYLNKLYVYFLAVYVKFTYSTKSVFACKFYQKLCQQFSNANYIMLVQLICMIIVTTLCADKSDKERKAWAGGCTHLQFTEALRISSFI